MNQLLLDYLPLVVFIGVALVLGTALLIAPFIVAFKAPIRSSFPLTNAGSIRLTTRA